MRKFIPASNELYHIFNRGTEKRTIFFVQKDYERFLVNLIFFNTKDNSITNLSRYNLQSAYQKIPNNPLVKIHAFCLMPNHFHLVLEQVIDNGIARFMHKVEMGYSQYFNNFHSRSGNLFQGMYKILYVDNDSYRMYLPLYIHLNALELLYSERHWKERGIKDKANALNFLKNYPWSSLVEYLNKVNMPFIAKDIFNELYKNPNEWENALKNWLPEYQQMLKPM